MKISAITTREHDFICLYNDAKEASKQFQEAIQRTAQIADTTPAVVRKYIAALASERANTVIKETEQLSLLFRLIPSLAPNNQTTVTVIPAAQVAA